MSAPAPLQVSSLLMWPFTSSLPSPARLSQLPREANTGHDVATPPAASRDDNSEVSPAAAAPTFSYTGHPETRLSIPLPLRLPIVGFTSFTAGVGLGAMHGSQMAALRYTAENAHRMPTNPQGWFLYQKSKNYHAALGGMKEGFKMGTVVTAWATLFVLTEATVDEARAKWFTRARQRDVGSTVVAGMTVAGLYGWKNGMDRWTFTKTARTALKWSVVFGLVQDSLAWATGEPPAYIEWAGEKTWRRWTRLQPDKH